MSKGNLFLGMARGKIGDVVFSRSDGQQVARARNRSPRNPQSIAQMVQRIILNTCSKAYSMMQPIVDHSFEGLTEGPENQRRFMKTNIAKFRDALADVIADPSIDTMSAGDYYNFNYKDSFLPVVNDYIISEGVLPMLDLSHGTGSGYYCLIPFHVTHTGDGTATYAEVVAALGLEPGDQLTFIQTTANDSSSRGQITEMSGFHYARIILEPGSGDMSTEFATTDGELNDPNPRNEGVFDIFSFGANVGIEFNLQGVASAEGSSKRLSHAAVIASRYRDGRWLRSNAILRPIYNGLVPPFNGAQLIEAYFSYLSQDASALYLNQAEVII